MFNENAGTVEVEVIRSGSDLAHTSMVWCAPKPLTPPSAYPGVDFVPSASQLTFAPQQTVEVSICKKKDVLDLNILLHIFASI